MAVVQDSTFSGDGSASARPPRLLDRVRDAVRVRHYSRRTEEAYVAWIRRFILFHRKRRPNEMGEREVGQFLSWLAVREGVSASTQNQALSARCHEALRSQRPTNNDSGSRTLLRGCLQYRPPNLPLQPTAFGGG